MEVRALRRLPGRRRCPDTLHAVTRGGTVCSPGAWWPGRKRPLQASLFAEVRALPGDQRVAAVSYRCYGGAPPRIERTKERVHVGRIPVGGLLVNKVSVHDSDRHAAALTLGVRNDFHDAVQRNEGHRQILSEDRTRAKALRSRSRPSGPLQSTECQ